MQELVDKQAALKKMCESCGRCEMFEKAMRTTHPDFVTDKCDHYKFLAEQPTIEAEPVIHCKDCAFWERKRVSCEGLARCRTGESGYRCRFGHDFCSRAQRREEVSEDVGTD